MACSVCGQNKPLKPRSGGHFTWCADCHRQKRRKYDATYQAKPSKAKLKRRIDRAYAKNNYEKTRAANRASVLKLRREMIAAYGGACTCCGETHEEFLTLEHMRQDGAEHRRRAGGCWAVYRELRRLGWPKDGYTVLCMNCNWAARLQIVCPHKRTPNSMESEKSVQLSSSGTPAPFPHL